MAMILNGTNLSFGQKGDDGKSAYDIAREQGFSGTEEEFGQALSSVVETQMLFGRFNKQTTWNEDETVFTQTWTYDGDSYSEILTNTDPVWIRELSVNGVTVGTWTITYDDVNRVKSVVYTA